MKSGGFRLFVAISAVVVSSLIVPVASATEGVGLTSKVESNVAKSLAVTANVPGRTATGMLVNPAAAAVTEVQTSERLLVQFVDGVSENDRANVRSQAGVASVRKLKMLSSVEFWKMAPGRTLRSAQQLMNSPFIRTVELDVARKPLLSPNDPQFYNQWDMSSINAPAAWDRTTGSPSIIVAVLDTGVKMDHPDLAANIWVNTAEKNGTPGVDDDGNGKIDDVNGWDFVSGDNDPSDEQGHGTHVAGTIAAKGNNGIGVAGVAWNVKIMPLRICGELGCYMSDAMAALDYAVAKGVRISNNSYGGNYSASDIEQQVISAAGTNGHLFVAAAGNNASNNDATPFFPASYPLTNIISVASNNWVDVDELSAFSNFGYTSVHISAPGDYILSTSLNSGTGYQSMSGTSMAAPHVAGAAALVASQWLAQSKSWTPQEMRTRLMVTSRDAARGVLAVASGGILDVGAATNPAIVGNPMVYVHMHGTGSGQVTSSYGSCTSVDCRIKPGLAAGSTVRLTASPATGSTFTGWTGACTGTSLTCDVVLRNEGPSVNATFRTPVPGANQVTNLTATSQALPNGFDPTVDPFVKVQLSGDGLTRTITRWYLDSKYSRFCYYSATDNGGITVERKINGVWTAVGSEIKAPAGLDSTASSRYFNCRMFGADLAMSRDGSVIAVNLGADYFPAARTENPSLCGLAVYRRTDAGWSSPTIVRPASYDDCFTPSLYDGWLESEWYGIKMSEDGTRILIGGADTVTIFDYLSGTWTRTASKTVTREKPYDIFGAAEISLSGDGKTIALAYSGRERSPVGPYGGDYGGNYYLGHVYVFKNSTGTTWDKTLDLIPSDYATTGTNALGLTVALSADGSTLVASYGRTWATVRSDENWVGGAWVISTSTGTVLRNIVTPFADASNYSTDRAFMCPMISGDASRILCHRAMRWGFNPYQGWMQFYQRAGDSWSNAPTSTYLYNPDGRARDANFLTSATSDLTQFVARFDVLVFVKATYGANTVGLLGTMATAPVATFSTPVSTSTGFTVNITNYDSAMTYSIVPSAGSVTRGKVSGTTLPLTVSGLTSGQSARVTVTTTRSAYLSSSAEVTGTAGVLAAPTFASVSSTATSFVFNVTNWSSSNTYTCTASPGTCAVGRGSGTNLPITVSGLSASSSSTVTVNVNRTGFPTASDTYIGTTLAPPPTLPTPTFGTVNRVTGGFNVAVTNYNSAYTYTLKTSAGKVSRTGSTITVTSLRAGQSAIVTVTVSQAGSTSSSATVSGSAL